MDRESNIRTARATSAAGLQNEAEFNAALHRRINTGVTAGSIHVVDNGIPVNTNPLVDLFVTNRLAGKPLFGGARVYRGTKDPDSDAGSFDPAVKHATPRYAMARGYAETANAHIGLVSKATHGIGMLAEYELPEDAVFYRNFGLETAAKAGETPSSLTVKSAEELAMPLVDAVVSAGSDEEARRAVAALDTFCDRELYELALAAEQKPVRQWVVHHDERGSRLLEYQDRGPLADVMIDAVRARKVAVDGYSAAKVARYLRAGGTHGLDRIAAFAPGVGEAVKQTVGLIDATLVSVQEATFSVAHDSLSAAIAWRRAAQRSVRLMRLTNSDTTIESNDRRLSGIHELQEAMEDVERAMTRQLWRPEQAGLLALFQAGALTASALERQRSVLASATEQEEAKATRFGELTRARSIAAEALAEIQGRDAFGMGGGVVARTLYRLRRRTDIHREIETRRGHLAGVETALVKLSEELKAAGAARDSQKAAVILLTGKLHAYERGLTERARDGALEILPVPGRLKTAGLSVQDWRALASVAESAIRESDALIERGRAAAGLFVAVATHGLDAGLMQDRGGDGEDDRTVHEEHEESLMAQESLSAGM